MVRALGHFKDPRSLPFLVDLIRKNEDLAEQDLALLSLARQKSRGAKLFLKSFYAYAPEALKPRVAYALGLARVYEASGVLLQDLADKRKRDNPAWLKNLILALGELKEFKAVTVIHEMLKSGLYEEQDLRLAFLFALGRLERDVSGITQYESLFMDESIQWQVYQSTLSQVQIRSQFKLEDYLSKIFEAENPHSLLPFELRGFPWSDVEAGLTLFPKEQFRERHVFCSRVFPEEVREAYLRSLEMPEDEWEVFFGILARSDELPVNPGTAVYFRSRVPEIDREFSLKLAWMDAFLPVVDFETLAKEVFSGGDDSHRIRFLNLWSERAVGEDSVWQKKTIKSFLKYPMGSAVYSRMLRACVEIGVREKALEDSIKEAFQDPERRSALLRYCETFSLNELIPQVLSLQEQEKDALAVQILAYFESLSAANVQSVPGPVMESLLLRFWNSGHVSSVLRVLRLHPHPHFEAKVIEALKSKEEVILIQAIIAAKAYAKSRDLSEVLGELLEHPSPVVRGRVFDSLLSHVTLSAKRSAYRYFSSNLQDEFIVDKFYRGFDPERKGGEEFYRGLEQILKSNPDHDQWEKLVSLRDRMNVGSLNLVNEKTMESSELGSLDEHLKTTIPQFQTLDPTAKLAIRAAEQPFLAGNLVDLPIDKAPIVLEYCKALDLILEKHLGQKHLFPKLDRELHEFQTLWHRVGFGDEYPQADRVLSLLGLKGKIAPELFPLHKAKLMSGTFFNGKILQDRFKIFDGLRAWAVIFLFFARKIPAGPQGSRDPVLRLSSLSDEKCIQVAKRLMQLQDLRNPAAHRQTYSEIESVKAMRNEAVELINVILESVS